MNVELNSKHEALIREALLWERKYMANELGGSYSREYMEGMHHAFSRAFDLLGITPEMIRSVEVTL